MAAYSSICESETTKLLKDESCISELHKWIWLTVLPAIPGCYKSRLLPLFSDIHELYAADVEKLQFRGIHQQEAFDILLSSKHRERAWTIIDESKSMGISPIHINNPEYPFLLKMIPDAPLVLYRLGEPITGRCISVVGSRRATGYGINMAERLSSDLADAGFVIISGMARGIDTAAHTGALKSGGKTIAVLANSVDIIYPPENRALSERIVKNGTLLSEYPPGTPPLSYYFPVRNRIISGLSEAVLVIEAGEKSGSLITVQCALEQGRDVFAVPGNALSVTSRGCNRIIREGAGLVQEVEDILESLHEPETFQKKTKHSKLKNNLETLAYTERMLLNRIRMEPLSTGALCAQTGMNASEVQQTLLLLELKNVIIRDLDGTIHPRN